VLELATAFIAVLELITAFIAVWELITAFIAVLELATAFIAVLELITAFIAVWELITAFIIFGSHTINQSGVEKLGFCNSASRLLPFPLKISSSMMSFLFEIPKLSIFAIPYTSIPSTKTLICEFEPTLIVSPTSRLNFSMNSPAKLSEK
jgi:hypothetical protein